MCCWSLVCTIQGSRLESLRNFRRNKVWAKSRSIHHLQNLPECHFSLIWYQEHIENLCKTIQSNLLPRALRLSPRISTLTPAVSNLYLRVSNLTSSPRTSSLSPRLSSLIPWTSNLAPRTSNLSPKASNRPPKTSSFLPGVGDGDTRINSWVHMLFSYVALVSLGVFWDE